MKKIWDLNVGDQFEHSNEIWYVKSKSKFTLVFIALSNRNNRKTTTPDNNFNVKIV